MVAARQRRGTDPVSVPGTPQRRGHTLEGKELQKFYTPITRVIKVIDRFTSWYVYLVTLLMVPMILANVVEVLMRYVLGRPTTWAADVTVMSYGSLFMLGSAYAMLKGAHVRTDIFFEGFSDRTKGIIDGISYLFLFLPVMGFIFVTSIDDFIYAYSIDERSILSLWRPILWPLRAVIPLAALLMFVQGISELLKALWAASTGKELEHREKIEI
jgi:TRAP-type mannitol/chloroaromatic compound transport system permease small subunit